MCPGERKQVREGESVLTTLYLSALPTLAVPSTTKTLVNFQASESPERNFYMLVIPYFSQIPGRERCPFSKEAPTGYQQQSPPCTQSMQAAGAGLRDTASTGIPRPQRTLAQDKTRRWTKAPQLSLHLLSPSCPATWAQVTSAEREVNNGLF